MNDEQYDKPFDMEEVVAEISKKYDYVKLKEPFILHGGAFHTVEGANSAQKVFTPALLLSTDGSLFTTVDASCLVPYVRPKVEPTIRPRYEHLCIFNLKILCVVPNKHFLRRFPNLLKPVGHL